MLPDLCEELALCAAGHTNIAGMDEEPTVVDTMYRGAVQYDEQLHVVVRMVSIVVRQHPSRDFQRVA